MKRRAFVAGMAAVMAAPVVAEAQQPGRTYRIGLLLPHTVPRISPARDAFNQVLSDLGFVDGQNLIAERLGAGGYAERLPLLAMEFVKRRMDVIVAVSSPAVHAAKDATSEIPIVMADVADPVADGFVASLARPHVNITGPTNFGIEARTKVLGLIKEVLPRANRVVIVLQRDNVAYRDLATRLHEMAKPLGLTLNAVEVRDVNELERSFGAIVAERTDAIWFSGIALAGWATAPRTAQLALRHRLPAICSTPHAVEMGGLFSYNEIDVVHFRRVARYVGRILQGAKPAELPVEQPTQLHFAINLKTARTLGLTIPASVLLRADQVIE